MFVGSGDRDEKENDAVSPVVGVILLAGIAVVLSTLIGVLVVDLSDSQTDPVVASFEYEFEQNETYNATNINDPGQGPGIIDPDDVFYADKLTVTHNGGDPVPSENLELRVTGADVKYINETGALHDYGGNEAGHYQPTYTFEQLEFDDEVTVSDSTTIVTNKGDYLEHDPEDPYHPEDMLRNATVQLVYEDGDQGFILSEWERTDN